MMNYQARVATPDAARILFKLCKHFARKVPARFDAQHGEVLFPFGRCQLRADADALYLSCQGRDEDQARHVMAVLDSHLALMSRASPLVPDWLRDGSATPPTPAPATAAQAGR